MSLAGTDWLFTLGAALLAAAGVALLLWALWGDWLRGVLVYRRTGTRRRRCSKCWYDMAGVQGLRCPECGREAKRGSRLLKSRRRRVLAAMACVLILGVPYPLSRGPQIVERGWPAGVPTTALVLTAPWIARGKAVPSPRAAPRRRSTADALLTELTQERLVSPLFAWQRWWMLRFGLPRSQTAPGQSRSSLDWALSRMLRRKPMTGSEWARAWSRMAPALFRTRNRWPEGVAVYVTPLHQSWLLSDTIKIRPEADGARPAYVLDTLTVFTRDHRLHTWSRGSSAGMSSAVCVIPLSQPQASVRFTATVSRPPRIGSEVEVGRFEPGVSIGGPLEEHMRAGPNAEIERAMLAGAFTLRISTMGGLSEIVADAATSAAIRAALASEGVTLAIRMELLRDGERMSADERWWSVNAAADSVLPAQEWTVFRANNVSYVRSPSTYRWTLRIRSDPELALRDYESDRCWEGSLELPLDPVLAPLDADAAIVR